MNETRHFVGFFLCLMAVLARIAYVNFLTFFLLSKTDILSLSIQVLLSLQIFKKKQ